MKDSMRLYRVHLKSNNSPERNIQNVTEDKLLPNKLKTQYIKAVARNEVFRGERIKRKGLLESNKEVKAGTIKRDMTKEDLSRKDETTISRNFLYNKSQLKKQNTVHHNLKSKPKNEVKSIKHKENYNVKVQVKDNKQSTKQENTQRDISELYLELIL